MKWTGVLAAILLAASASAQDAAFLKTQQDRESYAIGVDLARNLKGRGVQVEVEPLLKGMRDVLSAGELLMTLDEVRETLRAYQAELRKKQSPDRKGSDALAQQNLENGAAFLAENKTKAGVVTLPSGLQYKILKAGTGKRPTETDTVECRHRGTHIDGQEFNSSDRTGKPAIWDLKGGSVPPGVKEALLLMPVGSKWQIFVPPEHAYGAKGIEYGKRGAGHVIGPMETLIFEIELLAIK
jgi:FKBP-type peptidyl-prolyl cis-trans isomerase